MLYRRFLQILSVSFLLFIASAQSITAIPVFSTSSGVLSDFKKPDETKDLQLNLTGFFTAQLNLNNNLIFRGECSIITEDIIGTGLFNDTNAAFCIDELSLTYIKPFLGNTQYISTWIGTYEPVGGDTFIRRIFGLQPFTPFLTESWLGIRKPNAYAFYGTGFSYTLQFGAKPLATGTYIYVNKENLNNDYQLNLDLRGTANIDRAFVDFSFGLATPFSTKNGDQDVIILVNELFLHGGIEADIGNPYTTNIYFTSGFDNLPLTANSTHKIESKDFYFFIEPRFAVDNDCLSFSFFNIPDDKLNKFFLIQDNLGLSFALTSNNAHIANLDLAIGINSTLSYPGKDFLDVLKPMDNFKAENWNFSLIPFVNINLKKNIIKMLLVNKLNKVASDQLSYQSDFYLGFKSN